MKVSLLALCSLVSIPQTLPLVLKNNMSNLVYEAVRILVRLIELKKQQQQAKKSANNDEDDSEDGEMVRDDGFSRAIAMINKKELTSVYTSIDELVIVAQAIALLVKYDSSVVASILAKFSKQEQEVVQHVMAIAASLPK